jgi:ABC-2 type transport system permease protein
MSKVSLVIKREYFTRIRNKTFLLSTFLLPIMLMLLFFGGAFFASRSAEKQQKIVVVNDPGFMRNNLKSDSGKVLFAFDATVADSSQFAAKGYDGMLLLSSDTTSRSFTLYSKKTISAFAKERIESKLNKAFENRQLQNMGISTASLDSVRQGAKKNEVNIKNEVVQEGGKSKKVNVGLNYAIGYGSGILIYLTMFIFGAMVMRGVMEEKTNRIAEVIVSSIKPFQLMLGKIIGIGAVGLTQLLLWIVLIFGLLTVAQLFVPSDTMQQVQQLQQSGGMMPGGAGAAQASDMANNIFNVKSNLIALPWSKIIFCFIFYFLGGYLFYSALFAAVGSVINEDPQEAQSLMMPISMPIVFGFIILSTNISTPDSPAMFWASMIPFTSPIVMMGRVASDVPWWQLGLSMALLVGGFLFTTWLAGKIYRTGILLYGKKASWKEMIKWAFRKK